LLSFYVLSDGDLKGNRGRYNLIFDFSDQLFDLCCDVCTYIFCGLQPR